MAMIVLEPRIKEAFNKIQFAAMANNKNGITLMQSVRSQGEHILTRDDLGCSFGALSPMQVSDLPQFSGARGAFLEDGWTIEGWSPFGPHQHLSIESGDGCICGGVLLLWRG